MTGLALQEERDERERNVIGQESALGRAKHRQRPKNDISIAPQKRLSGEKSCRRSDAAALEQRTGLI